MSINEPGITSICDLQQVAPLYHRHITKAFVISLAKSPTLWLLSPLRASLLQHLLLVPQLCNRARDEGISCISSHFKHQCLQMSPALCQCSTHLQLHGTLSISGLQAFITILLDGLDFAAETHHLASSGLRHEPDVPVHRQGLQYKHFGSPK